MHIVIHVYRSSLQLIKEYLKWKKHINTHNKKDTLTISTHVRKKVCMHFNLIKIDKIIK